MRSLLSVNQVNPTSGGDAFGGGDEAKDAVTILTIPPERL